MWSQETGSWSSSDETRDEAGAETDHRDLLGKTVIEENPGEAGETSGQVGVPAGHDSTKVSTEGGTTVESEPSEPKENSSEGDERDIVRAEVDEHTFLTTTENEGIGKSTGTGNDFDGTTTSIVQNSPFEGPSIDVPDPAGDRAVDNGHEEETEHHGWKQSTSFSNGSHNDGDRDGSELELVERVQQRGDIVRARGSCSEGIS